LKNIIPLIGKITSERRNEYFVIIFFFATLVLGLTVFADYGISWDEPAQRDLGNANWNYIIHGDHALFDLVTRNYGPFMEMIEISPEKIFHLTDEKTIFISRHLINYLIFWLGTIFLFLLGKEIFKNRWYALLAVLMLYLTPCIFAHSFYNSKDLPLLSFFIIASYFSIRFLSKPTFILAAVFALVSGMLFAIRIIGVIVPAFAIFLFIINLVIGKFSFSQLKLFVVFIILLPLQPRSDPNSPTRPRQIALAARPP
jgi:hypothetical protein